MKLLKIMLVLVLIITVGVLGTLGVIYNSASKLIDESIAELYSEAIDMDTHKKPNDPTATPAPTIGSESVIKQEQPSIIGSEATIANEPASSSPSTDLMQPEDSNAEELELSDAAILGIDKAQLQAVDKVIPVMEKVELTKMILAKLSSREINELKSMASEGFSAEEKKKAIELVYSKFTVEEIEYIKALFMKYLK